MRKLILIILLLPFVACKKTVKEPTEDESKVEIVSAKRNYPEALSKIFEAHGGLQKWKQQRTLSFVLPKSENPETHTIDLWSRNEKIETDNFTLGFDGKPWVLDKDKVYEGNPEFYHNLMFYFYAMPFVLADEGVVYDKTEELVYEGVTYPGIAIGYNDGVGTSPKDNYYIHYDPDTDQMAWLGYTVTYRSGEKSNDIRWIRYNDWTTTDGLILPNSISWHTVEDGQIKEARNQVFFENVSISDEAIPASFFSKPEEVTYWKKLPSK